MFLSKNARLLGRLVGLGVALAVAPLANAQTTSRLVNIDTGVVLPKGSWEAYADGRYFWGNEQNGYGNVAGYYGLGDGFGLSVKGAFGARKTFNGSGFKIRYGGTDIEGQIRYALKELPGLSFAAGVALPSTPSQDQAFMTYAVDYKLPVNEIGLYLGIHGMWRDDVSFNALTVGANYVLNPEWSLVGDFSIAFDGDNSFSTADADRQRTAAFGAGLRYVPSKTANGMAYTIGITNALGGTTGFSTAASLGGSTGVFLGVSIKG